MEMEQWARVRQVRQESRDIVDGVHQACDLGESILELALGRMIGSFRVPYAHHYSRISGPSGRDRIVAWERALGFSPSDGVSEASDYCHVFARNDKEPRCVNLSAR
jgi:hypothetical protein